MENRKGHEIFLGVIGVATLLVAIIGATFAYFSASASSGNEAVAMKSTILNLGYAEDTDDLSTDLIPSTSKIALYSATDPDWLAGNTYTYVGTDGKEYQATGKGLCKDENNNEICGVYRFTIGNPNKTTAMDITGSIHSTLNEFTNIKFAIYDEEGTQVHVPTYFPKTGEKVDLTLNQKLSGSALGCTTEEDPTTCTRVNAAGTAIDSTVKIAANVRSYDVVIWVEETKNDQTLIDSGKMLTAAVKFSTGTTAGVTGVIAAADGTKKPTE